MADVKVYTTNFCPYCVAAKRLLKQKGVEFEELNLSDDPAELAALKNRTGMRTVPQIFIKDRLIGGFDDLSQLDQSGELDKLLS
jgi:glutaredoxin 3